MNCKAINKNKLISKLNKATFWNCDISNMDYEKNKNTIIKRIIQSGTENDEIIMWKLYSYDEIKKIAIKLENLNEDRLRYMAFVLELDKKDFKCYEKMQFP